MASIRDAWQAMLQTLGQPQVALPLALWLSIFLFVLLLGLAGAALMRRL